MVTQRQSVTMPPSAAIVWLPPTHMVTQRQSVTMPPSASDSARNDAFTQHRLADGNILR